MTENALDAYSLQFLSGAFRRASNADQMSLVTQPMVSRASVARKVDSRKTTVFFVFLGLMVNSDFMKRFSVYERTVGLLTKLSIVMMNEKENEAKEK